MDKPNKLASLDVLAAEGGANLQPSQFVVQRHIDKLSGGYWADIDETDGIEPAAFASPDDAFEAKKMLEVEQPHKSFRVIRRIIYEWVIE